MLPDKRRAGRAIRKARREARPDWLLALEAFGMFANALAEFFEVLGRAFISVADAMRTPPARVDFAVLPGGSVRELSRPPEGDHSQNGVYRVTEAHSASEDDNPFEGIGDD